ncbi:hypothetical protein OKW50_000088 [Paraburkholderia youngii]|uniref:hypothetical protein n=1 Tax=Paraburkholderia youngii TaxID=2782701 RepID=UPI003D1D25A3
MSMDGWKRLHAALSEQMAAFPARERELIARIDAAADDDRERRLAWHAHGEMVKERSRVAWELLSVQCTLAGNPRSPVEMALAEVVAEHNRDLYESLQGKAAEMMGRALDYWRYRANGLDHGAALRKLVASTRVDEGTLWRGIKSRPEAWDMIAIERGAENLPPRRQELAK